MGNSNKKSDQLTFNSHDWQQVEKAENYEVMKNKSGQLAHLYHFNIKSQRPIDQQIDLYEKRKRTGNWVQVIGAKLQKSGFGFCGTQENANILTERIPLLLNTIGKLNQQQSNIILYNALTGYSDISKIIVPGTITDKMIGFTPSGQTKVWVNENFGMNYPANYTKDLQLNERTVINNLLNILNDKTSFNSDYVTALRNNSTIQGALNFIRSNSGVSQSILDSNRINISRHSNLTFEPSNVIVTQTRPHVQTSTFPVISQVNVPPPTSTTVTQTHFKPQVISSRVSQSNIKRTSVSFNYNPVSTSGKIGGSNIVKSSTYVNQPFTQIVHQLSTQPLSSGTSSIYVAPVNGVSSTLRKY